MVAITKPSAHFQVVTDTGANILATAQAVFPSNYLIWIKDRANANNHQLIDTVRGASAVLQSNSTGTETTYSAPAGNSVAWCWKANGAGVSNTDGSITSTVSANQTAGFSIVTYTGTGANATVGHGLGVAPKMVIVKKISGGTQDWGVYHANQAATPQNNTLYLNLTNATIADANMWNNTAPTSTVFSIGTSGTSNPANPVVAYCFAEIPGYSKFGSYVGNGSADGPFVYCGFRPKYVLCKMSSSTADWCILDSARSTYNAAGNLLFPDLASAEAVSAYVDFTATGFKWRTTVADMNNNTSTYIFAAFAEYPFGGSNCSPSPAR